MLAANEIMSKFREEYGGYPLWQKEKRKEG
jgi:hypothetical protein